jgi:hypothetical protein
LGRSIATLDEVGIFLDTSTVFTEEEGGLAAVAVERIRVRFPVHLFLVNSSPSTIFCGSSKGAVEKTLILLHVAGPVEAPRRREKVW